MIKRSPQGLLAVSFTHAHLANADVGDPVKITGDFTVDQAGAGDTVVGFICSLDKYLGKCVVELRGCPMLVEMVVGANAVTAGDWVKISAAAAPGAAGYTGAPQTVGVQDEFPVVSTKAKVIPATKTNPLQAEIAATETSPAIPAIPANVNPDMLAAFGLALNGGATGATITILPVGL